MGFFRSSHSSNASGGKDKGRVPATSSEQSPIDDFELPARRPSTLRSNARRSSGLSRNSSGRSVSCSAKTIKVGTGMKIISGSNNTMSTRGESSKSQSMRQSIDKFRQMCTIDSSFRSFVSDLDLESAEMAPIGEGSTEFTKYPNPGPQHDTEGTSSELYPSADFTLASGSLHHKSDNSKQSNGAHSNSYSKGSRDRSRSLSQGMDNISTSEFFDGLSVASASVMMDKTRAEKVGRSGTRFVYIVLLITGVLVSVLINIGARRFEEDNFELEFRSFARETADLAETNADHTFSQLKTMATAITSEGLLDHHRVDDHHADGRIGTWPNVTIPHFDKRIEDFTESFGAIMLLYVPLVEAKDKEAWEHYANEHAPWKTHKEIADVGDIVDMDDALGDDFVPDMHNHADHLDHMDHGAMNHSVLLDDETILDDDGNSDRRQVRRKLGHDDHMHEHGSHHSMNADGFMKIHPCNHIEIEETREGFFNVSAFENDILTNFGGFENPDGLTAPIYQYGGPGHVLSKDSHIALMDLYSHVIFKKEVLASIEYSVPVISEYMDVNFLTEALSTVDLDAQNSSLLWDSEYSVYGNNNNNNNQAASGQLGASMTLPSIRSLTLHPVKETFEPDARTIGFVVGVVPWNTFFRNVLKSTDSGELYDIKEVNGIVVKVESDCGSVFTFVLNSRNGTSEVRLGDWKEQYQKYEHLNHSSRFFWKEHPKGQSKHCHFDLHIYPNDEFRDMYRTDSIYYSSIVGGIFIFTALLFACYDHFIFKGQQHIVNEASGMIVQNARRAAKNERDLNDFIAHEVRNPLAAAISACSFVSAAVTEDEARFSNENGEATEAERLALIASDEKRKEVQDDINIIDSSLHFINDLLRNMLDMQRAGSNEIQIEKKPTNIMDDIFKPVEAMLHLRDVPFKVIMEVDSGLHSGDDEDDEQLVVMTDPMRLKQVMLNLTRNATKFVEKGFIRCTANVNPINGFVELRVDDSGPGIPIEKRNRVFGKFQQSLDLLQQGTGIGLSLCKKMIDMMGGSLFIDEDYNSGIDGCRGTRFVIQLKIPPLQLNKLVFNEPEMTSFERARLRRKHLLACTDSMDGKRLSGESLEFLGESVNFSVSSGSKEITFEDEIESGIRLQDPLPPATEKSPALGVAIPEKQGEEDDKKEGSTMLPLPTALQMAPTEEATLTIPSDVVDDSQQSRKITELPKNLSVLFVDDDMVLRKLFSRTLKKINPTWNCKEASSGEMAIELISSRAEERVEESTDDFADEVESRNEDRGKEEPDCGFDLIFMDQYMASVQKQLLGTETVRKIRAKGFYKPIICGLSANDVEDAFYHAGSDAFMFKPFPCKKDELEKELLKVMNSRVRDSKRKSN